MALSQREQRKMLANLAAMLADEEHELPKMKRLSAIWQWVGALLVVAALFAAFQHQWTVMVVVVIGVLGGFAAGLSVLYGTFLAQWPVIKPLLDREAVEEANRQAARAGES